MKSFEQWTRDIASGPSQVPQPDTPDIPNILIGWEDPDAEGGYSYPCTVCGNAAPIRCDPHQFKEYQHYCGSGRPGRINCPT
jgi:hypothetical protein